MSAPSTPHTKRMISLKAERFTESVIREMTRLAMKHGAVNLAQGFPDFPAPAAIKQAAQDAIARDINQYAITWGAKPLRDAIAAKFARTQGIEADPEREITVCCGSTEAMISAMMAIINPGDEVVVFEPFYENYGPDAILSGATPRFVKLRPPDWDFDRSELTAAFGPATKAIIVNTPNNPTGRVFRREQLEFIRELCIRWNAFAITDEIYEHILYDGAEHISIARLDGMRERTITINGFSKAYSMTGWRLGYLAAPEELVSQASKLHSHSVSSATNFVQRAGIEALGDTEAAVGEMVEAFHERRDRLAALLEQHGVDVRMPDGAFYMMLPVADDDQQWCEDVLERAHVATVPGSAFGAPGYARMSYANSVERIEEAVRRLADEGFL